MSRSPSSTGASAVHRTAPLPFAHDYPRNRFGGTQPGGDTRSLRSLIVLISVCAGSGLMIAACSSAANQRSSAGTAARPAIVNGPASAQFGTSAGARLAVPSAAAKATELTKLAPIQSIIYTANLTLRVKDVDGAATQATNDVTAAGGYVASEQQVQATAPSGAEVDLTLKVPVSAYHQQLTQLIRLGKRLTFSTQAQDVTQQVADVSSRVASAQDAIKQLRQLLSRAGDVGQLLQVQDEINAQESALESLIAQQQALAGETTFGTVDLTLLGHHAIVAKKHKRKKISHGLVAGLGTGWRALKLVVIWLLTALGTLLPFAVPIAAIGTIVYVGRRRVSRRRTQPAAASPPATS